MDDACTLPLWPGCAHVYKHQIGPYWKCAGCGELVTTAGFHPDCDNCRHGLHKCPRCDWKLDHTMTHNCPTAYGL